MADAKLGRSVGGRTDRHDCEKSARPGFLTSGFRQDGERWTCPDCGKVWVHVCDEAEGCAWFPAKNQPRKPDA